MVAKLLWGRRWRSAQRNCLFILFSSFAECRGTEVDDFFLFHCYCCSQLKEFHLRQTHKNTSLGVLCSFSLSLQKCAELSQKRMPFITSCLIGKNMLMDDYVKDGESTHSSRWPKIYPWTKSDSQSCLLALSLPSLCCFSFDSALPQYISHFHFCFWLSFWCL